MGAMPQVVTEAPATGRIREISVAQFSGTNDFSLVVWFCFPPQVVNQHKFPDLLPGSLKDCEIYNSELTAEAELTEGPLLRNEW